MSKERPTDDPRDRNDWGPHSQTNKPWKGNPEKEQRPDEPELDLENGTRAGHIEPGVVPA